MIPVALFLSTIVHNITVLSHAVVDIKIRKNSSNITKFIYWEFFAWHTLSNAIADLVGAINGGAKAKLFIGTDLALLAGDTLSHLDSPPRPTHATSVDTVCRWVEVIPRVLGHETTQTCTNMSFAGPPSCLR
jgi:hypothetical protein